MNIPIESQALDALFLRARTHNAWFDKPVDDVLLHRIWDLARMGATSANCSPMRVVFVKSPEAKARLLPALMEGNRAKVLTAPVTAIFGNDSQFFELLPTLFPHTDARAWFVGNDALRAKSAMLNTTLQAAYFIMAARALGLDTGPITGFSNEAVDSAFFADQPNLKSVMVSTLGYGDPASIFERSPRPEFDTFYRMA